MFWIVGGTGLVAGLQALNPNPVINGLVYELNHTDWQGLRFYDLIWPSFMLMTGMSLPFSYAKRSLTQTHHQILMRVLRRFAVLFLLGSLRESIHFNRPYLIELSSALQPIAVAYLAAFLMVRMSWRLQAAIGAAILVFYALLLAFVPAPGVPSGSYGQAANLVLWTDMARVGRVLP
jgi:predicted acyltransferase